ncbi:MAG: response regulator transcription factor [Gaiellaceae bacterium]
MIAPIRVLLLEDNAVFREALELLFGLRSDVDVVGSIGDGGAAVEACRELAPDVLLLDYRLPGMDGLRVAEALKADCPDVALVCLTASASPQELEGLAAAGVAATLTKDQELDVIIAALHLAAGRAPPE